MGRLQQEIGRFADAIREFHPDGSPFSGEILGATNDLEKLVQEQGDIQSFTAAANLQEVLQAIESLRPKLAIESSTPPNDLEKHLNDEIDGYRELLREDKPRTAIKLLAKLKVRVWSTASAHVRFRIASNLGAAHHKIGEYDTAAELLMEAATFDSQDPVGIANKIAALLLKGQPDNAHALAVSSVAQHPNNVHIAVQRLLAVAPHETVEDVWHSLPASVRTAPEPYINRIVSLREAGDDHWYGAGNEALAAHPNDERLQTIHAEGVLERILKGDPGAVGKAGPDVPTQAELEAASDILAKSWQRTLGPEITPQGAFAHNAALAKMIIGQPDAAAQLLDAAEGHGYTSEETKFMRISLYRKQHQIDEAIRIADTLLDSPKSQIIRADLHAERAPEEARSILADREQFTESRDIIAASLTVMEAYCEQRNFTDALQEAERLKARIPDDPEGPLAVFRIKHQTGEAGAEDALDDGLHLVTPGTDFPTRFLLCEALTAAARHNDVVDLLQRVTSTRFDSPALRMLSAAAASSDRRATLAKLLKEIPPEILKLPYYRRVKIALAFSTGDIRSAERQLREFLAIEPKNLAIHLQLLNALFRQNKQSDLKAEAARPSADFKGSPENFIWFAQFKKDFADWKEAHDLAYRVLLANQGSEGVNMGYMAMFLFERRPTPIDLNPAIVAENMAIGVKREEGQISTYVIEPEPGLRPTTDYLAPDHTVARLLLGKSTGDSVELPDHTTAQIVWKKPKELHALHVILENFNNLFPDAEGFEKVRFDTSSPAGLEPMLERVRERHDVVSSVASKYDSGMLPLALMARLVGTDPVSAALGIISSGHALRVCEGTQYERDMSFQAIAQNDRKGCVVDAVTLHFIRRLGLARAVEAVCGPIGIVEHSVSRIQQKIHELEESLDKPSMSVFYRDGEYFREETTREQKSTALAAQQADRTWIAEHAQLIPAEGGKDPSPEWDKMLQRFGSSFFDEARAASGSGRLLLSEDLPMRILAQTEYGVGGC
jgi:tetratricopeptide (TPR) repeat protein